eukprot:jgi/Picre1/32391/NNA_007737.t1
MRYLLTLLTVICITCGIDRVNGEINSRHTLPIISGKKSDDAVFRIGGTDPIDVQEEACGQNRIGHETQSRLVQVGVSLNCSSSVNEGTAGNYSRIVGGKRVKDSERYPYTALLFDGEGPFCSGVLISPKAILTAGHCVDDSTVADKRIPKNLQVIGYGKTDEFEVDMSNNLREVGVQYFQEKNVRSC